MIKKIIQYCSMLVLSVAFMVVSANAQNQVVNRIDANIPFTFTLGEKTFPAGDYVIRLSKVSPDSMSLLLATKDGKTLDNVLLASKGDAADGKARLIFGSADGQYFLSKVITGEKGFTLQNDDAKTGVSKNRNVKAAKAGATL